MSGISALRSFSSFLCSHVRSNPHIDIATSRGCHAFQGCCVHASHHFQPSILFRREPLVCVSPIRLSPASFPVLDRKLSWPARPIVVPVDTAAVLPSVLLDTIRTDPCLFLVCYLLLHCRTFVLLLSLGNDRDIKLGASPNQKVSSGYYQESTGVFRRPHRGHWRKA